MPAFLLHRDAKVRCAHAFTGAATPVKVFHRVKVSGKPIVTQTTLHTISGCKNPPVSGGPCATAKWVSAATRIRAGGVPVLLKNSQALTDPTQVKLIALVTQMRVEGT